MRVPATVKKAVHAIGKIRLRKTIRTPTYTGPNRRNGKPKPAGWGQGDRPVDLPMQATEAPIATHKPGRNGDIPLYRRKGTSFGPAANGESYLSMNGRQPSARGQRLRMLGRKIKARFRKQ